MSSHFIKPIVQTSMPVLGDLDVKLREDTNGEFLAECLEVLRKARLELDSPISSDASYKHESNLMDGALRAADQVLRSMWTSFHPKSVNRRFSTFL
jgi:hypothetical protein